MSLMRSERSKEGFGTSIAGEYWYEVSDRSIPGSPSASATIPLILIHGGPGFTSHYLQPLMELGDILPTVRYDQAGCGTARRGGARRDFTVDGYVAELESLRDILGAEKLHLFGHSFGGIVAGEYALNYPERVGSLIFASVSIDIPRWLSDAERLRAQLPLMTRMILREGDRTGDYSSQAYQMALALYYDRFVYRFVNKPECILLSERESDRLSYRTMWGPSELVVDGVLKGYNLTPRLSLIRGPALFLCGRYDEATPEAHENFASLIPGASCRIFEESAHHPHINETEAYLRTIREFLKNRLN